MELDGISANTSQLGETAKAAMSYLTSHVRSHSTSLKVQTSKGNYLTPLTFRAEQVDFKDEASWEHSTGARRRSGSTSTLGREMSDEPGDGDVNVPESESPCISRPNGPSISRSGSELKLRWDGEQIPGWSSSSWKLKSGSMDIDGEHGGGKGSGYGSADGTAEDGWPHPPYHRLAR